MTTSVDAGCYVFGIVDAGTHLSAPPDVDLAAGLRLIEHGDVAAVVGTLPDDRAVGRARDLLDHDRLLAHLVQNGITVLPMRFGTVLPGEDAVITELLAARESDLRRGLDQVRDKVQYTVKASYEQEPVLREVIASNPHVAALRERGTGSFDDQVQLGESVVSALADLRAVDGPALVDEVGGGYERREHALAEPDDVLNAAYLIDARAADSFLQRVDEAAKRRAGRIVIRVVGPSPAYDFVTDG
jgi:hypothetical protein